MATEKAKAETILLPEGRLINASLFERDIYKPEKGAEGEPKYKLELAFDPDQVTGEGTVEDKLADAVAARWGEKAADEWMEGKKGYGTCLLDGDTLAAKRVEKGKEGDAYKAKIVIRADTTFNRDGAKGPGGIAVYGPDTAAIGAANQTEIYPGCYGIAAVTVSTYEDNRGDRCVKFYLKAFQKTKDGPKLAKSADHSNLFKPVASNGNAAPEGGARRRRAG